MAALSAAEQELQQFWAAAKPRMQQLGYSSAERGKIKGLLMGKSLTDRKEYFDGDDVEVKSALDQLLTPGAAGNAGAGVGVGMAAGLRRPAVAYLSYPTPFGTKYIEIEPQPPPKQARATPSHHTVACEELRQPLLWHN